MRSLPLALLASVTLSAFVAGLAPGPPALAQGGVAVVSSATYRDERGHMVLVGELRNDTGGEVALVALTVTFLDAGGVELAVANGIALVAQLLPGETAPFVVDSSSAAAADYERYEIVESHIEGGFGPVRRDLPVSIERATAVPSGGLRVDGRVINTTDAPLRVTEVVVALCDKAGTVLRARAGAVYETLAPGESTAFVVVYGGEPTDNGTYRTWVTAHPAP